MRIIGFYIFCSISISTYGQSDCNKLQEKFSSYSEAIEKINRTKFAFIDKVNTSSSSWVRGASFYSCNKRLGYFIIKTDKGNYIYKDLPINIWNSFKNSSSFGRYYDINIRNRYQLYLTN